MRYRPVRFVNGIILAVVLILTLTGMYGLFWTMNGWLWDVHRAAGWLLVALVPAKTLISLRSLHRGLRLDFDRGMMVAVSLLLAAVALLVIGLGVIWNWRLGPVVYPLRQTAVSWHWMLALALLLPFALHVWRRWPRPRRVDFLSRRGALKMIGLGGAALGSWWAADQLSGSRALSPRRASGSRLEGLFSGNRFPVTHTTSASKEQVDPASWRLTVAEAAASPRDYTYAELLTLPSVDMTASLDCTLGWYTTQSWRGARLSDLLSPAGPAPNTFGVRLESVTGYALILPWREAQEALLATHVGGETLAFEHGFPIRVVVPSRRGWYWVKWLARIEVVALQGPGGVGGVDSFDPEDPHG